MEHIIGDRERLRRAYQQQVADLAPAIAGQLIGGTTVTSVTLDAAIDVGVQRTRYADVLVEAGSHGIVIECKRFSRRVGKDSVSPRLVDFIDICLAHPQRRWSFCLVAATDVPQAAQEPVATLTRAGLRVANFERGTLAASCHFVFYRPATLDVGFILDEKTAVRGIILPKASDLLGQHDLLMDPTLPVIARVAAGLRIAQRDCSRMGSDTESVTSLTHGLLHLGMVQEAYYLMRYWHQLSPPTMNAYVDALMAKYQIVRLYSDGRPGSGGPILREMLRVFATAESAVQLSIATFAGPALARRRDQRGVELLNAVEKLALGLAAPDSPYYEFLAHLRLGQLSLDREFGHESILRARALLDVLPTWNRAVADALLLETARRPHLLHGIDTAFSAYVSEAYDEGHS